jgi:ribonuclease HII
MPQPPQQWATPVPGVRDSKIVGEEERESLFPELLACPNLVFGVSVIDHAGIDRVNILAASMLAMERAAAAAREAATRRASGSVAAEEEDPAAVASRAFLPREDAIAETQRGAAAAAAKASPTTAPRVRIHTVFVDGPRCPARIAAAANGLAGAYAPAAAAAAPASVAGKKRKSEGAAPPQLIPGATVVDERVDAHLLARLGPIFSAEPIIKGDSKVFAIAAASLIAKVTRDRIMRRLAEAHPGYGLELHKGYGTAAHMAALARLGPTPIHRMTFAPLKEWYPERAAAARAGGGGPVPSAAPAPAKSRKVAKRSAKK